MTYEGERERDTDIDKRERRSTVSIERNGNTIQILGKTETETQIETETDDGILKILIRNYQCVSKYYKRHAEDIPTSLNPYVIKSLRQGVPTDKIPPGHFPTTI